MSRTQHVLRGQYSYQNGFFVLNLPTLELEKISTLVNGNISTIGSRLWEHINDFTVLGNISSKPYTTLLEEFILLSSLAN